MALVTLERVLARQPKHPLALHLHVHLTEQSADPGRGTGSADTLARADWAAGHMLHMPAHNYLRVGRYRDVVAANLRALDVDAEYRSKCRVAYGSAHNQVWMHGWMCTPPIIACGCRRFGRQPSRTTQQEVRATP
jgi:hypothetical protein